MSQSTGRSAAPSPRSYRSANGARLRSTLIQPEAAAIGAFVVLFIVFSLMSNGLMVEKSALVSIASLTADLGIIGVFVSMLMISGHFDLSVGSVAGLSSWVGAQFIIDLGWNPWAAVVATLLVAACIGAVNGLIVVYTGLHSFVVTLGMLLIARGVLTLASGGIPERVDLPAGFAKLVAGDALFGFRMSLLWLIIAALIGHLLLNRTRFGNWTYSIGDSPSAANDLGVPVAATTVKLFVLSSFGAGLVGLIQMVRFASVDSIRGTGVELTVIAAVVIGGTSLLGGYGSVVGAVLGALVFGTIQVGLLLSGVPGVWFNMAVGILLIVAVFFNSKLVDALKSSGASDADQPTPESSNQPEQRPHGDASIQRATP